VDPVTGGVVTGVGDGEGAGDGDAAGDAVAVVAAGEAAGPGVPVACPVDPGELPQAASRTTTTTAANGFTTWVTAFMERRIIPCASVCPLANRELRCALNQTNVFMSAPELPRVTR
jgi:hypothetical protein